MFSYLEVGWLLALGCNLFGFTLLILSGSTPVTNHIPRGECAVPENIITPPQKELEFPVSGSVRPKTQRNIKLIGISPSVGEVLIFSGILHNKNTCMFSTTFLDVSGQFKQITTM